MRSSHSISSSSEGIQQLSLGGGDHVQTQQLRSQQNVQPQRQERQEVASLEEEFASLDIGSDVFGNLSHYTTYVQRPSSNGDRKWFDMNNSDDESVAEQEILGQECVIICRRQEVKVEFTTPSIITDEGKELVRACVSAVVVTVVGEIAIICALILALMVALVPPGEDCVGEVVDAVVVAGAFVVVLIGALVGPDVVAQDVVLVGPNVVVQDVALVGPDVVAQDTAQEDTDVFAQDVVLVGPDVVVQDVVLVGPDVVEQDDNVVAQEDADQLLKKRSYDLKKMRRVSLKKKSQLLHIEDNNIVARQIDQNKILDISWDSLHYRYPWACFLAAGGAKKVYKVYDLLMCDEVALSVMETKSIDNIQVVVNELAVFSMVSYLVSSGVCPNFISLHRVFTCAHAPPESCWGNDKKKYPKGDKYVEDKSKTHHPPRELKKCGLGYYYIQMQLANGGDAEELIKQQDHQLLKVDVARAILFQVSFALYAAAERFSIKHYDVKLLNVLVQNTESREGLILRYGLGSNIFALKMPPNATYIAKLADFGTANMLPSTNGLPVTIAQFTTLENTPPDYLILGDAATQGHSHDNFGLGLIMLHLFTGFRPYEEILKKVHCAPHLKAVLTKLWENEKNPYSVIRRVIKGDVDKYGNVSGEPDDTLYDTLYRYLVLFGIPEQKFQEKNGRLVWLAITKSLQGTPVNATKLCSAKKTGQMKSNDDCARFKEDCKQYSIRSGKNVHIARARGALKVMDGGLDLLFGLCHFNPILRTTTMDALKSKFMKSLQEQRNDYDQGMDVRSYTSFSTTTTVIPPPSPSLARSTH